MGPVFGLVCWLISSSAALEASSTVSFNYLERGPSTWWFFHPEHCDELLFPIQSPVRLSKKESQVSNLEDVTFSNYGSKPSEARLVNDGASLVLIPEFSEESQFPTVEGGPLIPGAKYRLDHLIWHWGDDEKKGAEHVIESKRSPMEVHLVHFESSLYGSYEEALQHENGVVILAFQYEISEQNPNYDFLTKHANAIQRPGIPAALSDADLPSVESLIGTTSSRDEYFSYHGSLTRPPCTNTVTWVVFTGKVAISQGQIESLRTLETIEGKKILSNFREPRPLLNRRPIFKPAPQPIVREQQAEDSPFLNKILEQIFKSFSVFSE